MQPGETPSWGKSVAEARQHILEAIAPLAAVPQPLSRALGAVLAEVVPAPHDAPRFDDSAMDGYAVRMADLEGATAPVTLPVAFEVPAGPAVDRQLPARAAARIMTGGRMPPGADTVIKREDTEELGDSVAIRVLPGRIFANVRRIGSYFAKGSPVLEPGQVIDPGAIGLLAAIGRTSVAVHRRPRVAVVATGDELVEIDEQPGPGQIRNSNAYMMAALVQQAGGEPVVMRLARDTVEDSRNRLEEALAAADLVLSIGGVSVGDYDVVRPVLEALGATMGFWKVRIKPGKPLAFGMVGKRPMLGLPGNPVSSWVAFQQFARPAIRKLGGRREDGRLPVVQARLLRDVKSPRARADYQRGRLDQEGGFLPYPDQSSGNLMSIVNPNGLAVIPEGVAQLSAGAEVDVELVPGWQDI